jgi:hypothetical protein
VDRPAVIGCAPLSRSAFAPVRLSERFNVGSDESIRVERGDRVDDRPLLARRGLKLRDAKAVRVCAVDREILAGRQSINQFDQTRLGRGETHRERSMLHPISGACPA